MSLDYDHIVSHDTRCWCAPQLFVEEETVSMEIWPGEFLAIEKKRVLVIHYESNLLPRRHGHPRKPRSYKV